MYLQRLEIQGFKSFAQKTIFEFPPVSTREAKLKSITAVVGPNGSGKSNVADAIRWVLGEQSLKLIRCKKADDVIFGGSETKARQGFAEVSLYFNNEDRELPIDFGEVALTRRVYRNGENEYLLNKSRVRLFDILLLLAKANFGQRTYSIIGQGMVDQIINISPFERKEFFDEATGVKQYQIKRDQAVNRLTHSRENLLQTNQILEELEPRLRSLERQVKRLEKKKIVETQLRDLQKQYYAGRWQDILIKKDKFNSEYEMKKSIYEAVVVKMNELKSKLLDYSRQESRQESFNNLQKEYNKLISERNELLKDLTVVKGKLSLEYVKKGQENLSWLSEKKDQIDARLSEIKESLNSKLLRLDDKQKTIEDDEEALLKAQELVASLNNELLEAETWLSKLKNSQAPSNSSRQVIQAVMRQAGHIKGIVGPVSQLFKVSNQYEQAISSALDIYANALVVQNVEAAINCIDYLKKNKLGSLIFIPLNKIKAERILKEDYEMLKENGAMGFAVEQIQVEDEYQKVFQYLLGKTVIVDNLNSAENLVKNNISCVSLDGDMMDQFSVMRGGFFEPTASLKLPDVTWEEQMRTVEVLKIKLNEAQREKDRRTLELNDLKMDLQISDSKVKSLQADLHGLLKDKEKISVELESNKIGNQDQDKYFQQLEARQKELERKLETLDETVSAKRGEIDRLNIEEEKKKKEMFRLQEQLQGEQDRVNVEGNKLHEVRIELTRLETHEEDLKNEIKQELGAEFDVSELASIKHESIPGNLIDEIIKLKKDLDLIGGIEPEVAEEYKTVNERYQFLSNQAQDLEKGIVDLEKMVSELDKIISSQFDSSFKKINKSFEVYFTKIFGGGKAKLDIIQRETTPQNDAGAGTPEQNANSVETHNDASLPSEPMEHSIAATGIEIMVAPPNKRVNHIAALSGGERTMTSLALICAIIDSNPAPFVVMDEVDAALDEANSEKFSAILHDLSRKSQFIVITHNQIVIHAADVMYGVTMGGDGVSRVLSMNFESIVKK